MYRNVRFGGVSQILNCLPPLAVPTPQHKELVRKFGVNIATPTTDGPIPVKKIQKLENLQSTVLFSPGGRYSAHHRLTGRDILCPKGIWWELWHILILGQTCCTLGLHIHVAGGVLFRKQSKQLCSSSILLRTCSINKNFIQTNSYLWWIVETTQLKDHFPSFRSKNPPNNCWNQHLGPTCSWKKYNWSRTSINLDSTPSSLNLLGLSLRTWNPW